MGRLVTSIGRRLARSSVQILVFLGVLALYLLLGVALWRVLDWYIDPSSSTTDVPGAKKDLFQALGLMMAGVAGAIGVYFTWRNLSQTRQNTERTLWLTEQGQITERFTRAIDQLGATDDKGKPKLEIRLGGIYALERIAKDSPDKDYSTVMEVLTAYARENAPHSSAKLPNPSSASKGAAEQEEGGSPPDDEQEEGGTPDETDMLQRLASPQKHPAAIRAIGDVVRRLHGEDGVPERYLVRLDLHNTDLKGTNLQGAHLREADLRGAYLKGAYLQEADLKGADLQGANLKGAHLQEADLQEADLRGADLQGANLKGAHLKGADLFGADLKGAHLRGAHLLGAHLLGAHLQEADLGGAYLKGANLQGAHLQGADLGGANLKEAYLLGAHLQGAHPFRANLQGADLKVAYLQGAELREADLKGADLLGAHLQGADLGGANLQGADLKVAKLQGADLQGANLKEARGFTQEQLEQAIGDKTTKLPEGVDPPTSWTQGEDKQTNGKE